MSARSSKVNRGGNMHRNFVGREVVRLGAQPTLETFCEQQWLLENEVTGRGMEIHKEVYEY